MGLFRIIAVLVLLALLCVLAVFLVVLVQTTVDTAIELMQAVFDTTVALVLVAVDC